MILLRNKVCSSTARVGTILVILSIVLIHFLITLKNSKSEPYIPKETSPFHATRESTSYSILACGISPKYSFWLPITALIWKKRQKYEPIIFLIDEAPTNESSWQNSPSARTVVEFLNVLNLTSVHYLKPNTALEGNAVLTSQVSRLYAAMLPFVRDTDWIVTSDVDLLPIASASYYRGDATRPIFLTDLEEFQVSHDIRIKFQEFEISNIGMTGAAWRRFMKYPVAPNVQDIVYRMNSDLVDLFGYGTANKSDIPSWSYDQILVSYRLAVAKHVGMLDWNRDVFVRNRTESGRIIRGKSWPAVSLSRQETETKYDAHMYRADNSTGYTEVWARTSWLVRYLLDDDPQTFRENKSLLNWSGCELGFGTLGLCDYLHMRLAPRLSVALSSRPRRMIID